MFEMAQDYVRFSRTEFEIVGGYLSPVSDAYKKAGLVSAEHRLRMCEIAVETSDWIMVDSFECVQKEYTPTAQVLDHADYELNVIRGGVVTKDGERKRVRICLLAGADLLETMTTPGVWSPQDLDHILGRYGSMIVERAGSDVQNALSSLTQWTDNIFVIPQLIQNDISSTKLRLFLKRDMSVQYLTPPAVVDYISRNRLYGDDSSTAAASSSIRGKEKEESGKTDVGASH
ncbi:hypothetical protein N7G274_002575 [Stereocaulon virgatum]|uniref:Nicotinamide-nucleotide adenylyltransferase n=1 Tax=Stereocaulon virgatum TaxID=373712 RepID=A0ABR4AH65_9LECA